MAEIVFLQANVDFTSPLSLEDVGTRIAEICFGGGQFVGQCEGIWDEVPAMRLDRIVLGLEVVLGCTPGMAGGYTLEVASKQPSGGMLPIEPAQSKAVICEFSTYLSGLLEHIPGIEIQPPAW